MDYQIEVIELAPQPIIVIEKEVRAGQIGAALAQMLPRAYQFAVEKGAEITGMPFMRYLDMDGDLWRIDAGIPVAKEIAGNDDLLVKSLPGGKAATTLHLGQYDQVGAAWDAIYAWAAEKGEPQRWGGWDVYENDPDSVNDPSELRTRLFYPLS